MSEADVAASETTVYVAMEAGSYFYVTLRGTTEANLMSTIQTEDVWVSPSQCLTVLDSDTGIDHRYCHYFTTKIEPKIALIR